MHPLFHLIAKRPQLLADHAESYIELVGAELGLVSTSWKRGALLNAAAFFCVLIAAVLAGVAAMLWATLPAGQMQAPWMLWATPLLPLVLAAVCAAAGRTSALEGAFSNLRRQVKADMAMLREAELP